MRPTIEVNSPTCNRPSSVLRLRMRGLPLMAPMRPLRAKAHISQWTANGPSIASPSMQTRKSDLASAAPVLSATDFPWLVVSRMMRSQGYRAAASTSFAQVSSVEPSSIAITS